MVELAGIAPAFEVTLLLLAKQVPFLSSHSPIKYPRQAFSAAPSYAVFSTRDWLARSVPVRHQLRIEDRMVVPSSVCRVDRIAVESGAR